MGSCIVEHPGEPPQWVDGFFGFFQGGSPTWEVYTQMGPRKQVNRLMVLMVISLTLMALTPGVNDDMAHVRHSESTIFDSGIRFIYQSFRRFTCDNPEAVGKLKCLAKQEK